MHASLVLDRARSAIGSLTFYELGYGGYDPARAHPAELASGEIDGCDCSGFVAWALGRPRHSPDMPGGWIETTAMVRDGKTPGGLFTVVTRPTVLPGMLLCYGDRPGVGQGHVGLISGFDSAGHLRVIHCSRGNYIRTAAAGHGDAIQETGDEIFWVRKDVVILRPDFIDFTGPTEVAERAVAQEGTT